MKFKLLLFACAGIILIGALSGCGEQKATAPCKIHLLLIPRIFKASGLIMTLMIYWF